MRLDIPFDQERQPPSLPLDCQDWLGQRELLRVCLEAVQTLDWSQPPLAAAPSRPCRPQMLMTLLTYCYARGIYASEDIVAAANTDWTIHYICAHSIPAERNLARFRRNQRAGLVHCLSRVLEELVRLQFDQFRSLVHDCPPHHLIRQARESARNRVEAASIIDSLVND